MSSQTTGNRARASEARAPRRHCGLDLLRWLINAPHKPERCQLDLSIPQFMPSAKDPISIPVLMTLPMEIIFGPAVRQIFQPLPATIFAQAGELLKESI